MSSENTDDEAVNTKSQLPDDLEDPEGISLDADDGTTTSTQTRWAYTNDVAALFIVVAFTGAVGAVSYAIATGKYSGQIDVGLLTMAFVALVLLAGTWLFGQDAIDALAKLRGN